MNVFAHVPGVPAADDGVLVAAAGAVIESLRKIPAPRSLCEIRMDEDDYRWLCDWANALQPTQLSRWLGIRRSRRISFEHSRRHITYAEAAGCLLLLLASETARRNASESSVWPAVRGLFSQSVGRVLFLQGHPTDPFKDTMEATTRKLGLRHVFGHDGTKEYYLSVYLQFGFTHNGITRLPDWLSGQVQSRAIQYLTGEHDAALQSESFLQLWNALRNYRRNNITEAHARNLLSDNPWVLPGWTEDLLKYAKQRPELGTSGDGGSVLHSDEERPPSTFLAEPRLRWDGSAEPKFTTSVINLTELDLTADRYLVKSGDDALARLFSTADGGYTILPDSISLSPDSPNIGVALIADDGNSPASQALTLWDPTEDVELFDLKSGKRLDANQERLRAGRDYGLLVSSDLVIEPPNMRFHTIGQGIYSKTLYLLRHNDANPVCVTILGEELWAPVPRTPVTNITPHTEPAWAREVSAQLSPSNKLNLAQDSLQRSLSIYGFDEDASLEYVRIASTPLNFIPETGGYTTEYFDITKLALQGRQHTELPVRLGLRKGSQQTTVVRTLVFSVKGVMRMTNAGWQVADSPQLSKSDAEQFVYKILLPPSHEYDNHGDLSLMEGSQTLRRLGTHPRPISGLAGYGASVTVNGWRQDEPLLTIAHSTYRPGIFKNILDARNRSFRIYLRHPIEPGISHQIILWKPGAPPNIMPAQQAVNSTNSTSTEWTVAHDNETLADTFVALAYDGACIGAHWPDATAIDDELTVALQTAAMLRWLHAPILSPNWLPHIRAFAHRHPAQALAAWLHDDGIPDGLQHDVSGDAWLSAARQVFAKWIPQPEQSMAIFTALNNDPKQPPIEALARLDQVIMEKVVTDMRAMKDI